MDDENKEYEFTVCSEEYGCEDYGPYDSVEEAKAGIERIQEAAELLNDGVLRLYSAVREILRDEDGWRIEEEEEYATYF
jgi:hypothetical protein